MLQGLDAVGTGFCAGASYIPVSIACGKDTTPPLLEPQLGGGSCLATALCPLRMKVMGKHQLCACSCLCNALRASMQLDVPRSVALALGTSHCQQRAGEGGILSSSQLPAGKNSPGPRVPVDLTHL